MLGPKGGMATRLERSLSTPSHPVKLYKTWCAAHRLEIVVKDAIKKFPQHGQFIEDVNKLGKKSLLCL